MPFFESVPLSKALTLRPSKLQPERLNDAIDDNKARMTQFFVVCHFII
jgi:hypothetical protein